jgi:hypothetical protein
MWHESRASAAWESENETSRKIALRFRVRRATCQILSVGHVSPENTTARPGFETTYPKPGIRCFTGTGVKVTEPAR